MRWDMGGHGVIASSRLHLPKDCEYQVKQDSGGIIWENNFPRAKSAATGMRQYVLHHHTAEALMNFSMHFWYSVFNVYYGVM